MKRYKILANVLGIWEDIYIYIYIYIPQYSLMAKPTIKYSQLTAYCHKGSHLSFFKMVHVKSL